MGILKKNAVTKTPCSVANHGSQDRSPSPRLTPPGEPAEYEPRQRPHTSTESEIKRSNTLLVIRQSIPIKDRLNESEQVPGSHREEYRNEQLHFRGRSADIAILICEKTKEKLKAA
jgi:hypothetical protein